MPAQFPYCEQYGFDANRRAARLALLGLGEPDHALARCLRAEVIGPHITSIIDQFYDYLLTCPEVQQVLGPQFDIAHLQATQRNYLLSLGIDFADAAYFEGRLRVGMAHARLHVPLSVYQSAYALLQQLIIANIPQRLREDPGNYDRLVAFILKITALDTSLAIETYYRSQVDTLEESIEALRTETHHLNRMVGTDTFTGLANHERILELLREDLLVQSAFPLCVGIADLDRFKGINDVHGHLVGDLVLRTVAERLHSVIRERDALGRYGGDEFILILRNTTPKRALQIAERVRHHVSRMVEVKGLQLGLTMSIGIACAEAGDTVESLLTRADSALYAAKRAGRDRTILFGDDTMAKSQPAAPEPQGHA